MIAFAALIDDKEDLQFFNHIVETYQIEMFRVARSVLGDNQLAEDAVQNALYGIAVSFHRVPSADADELHAYVLSCAKYAAYRILRSERHEETSELTELVGASPEDDPTFARIEQSEDSGRAAPLLCFRPKRERDRKAVRKEALYGPAAADPRKTAAGGDLQEGGDRSWLKRQALFKEL